MKPETHPDYHTVKIVMTDGTEFTTRTTWGKEGDTLRLDIDPKSHPAWTGGQQQLLDRGGRLSLFQEKFAGIGAKKERSRLIRAGASARPPRRLHSCSKAALSSPSCRSTGLPRSARAGDEWIVVSRRRTALCSALERWINARRRSGRSVMFCSSACSTPESLTLAFSLLAWASDTSPSLTARWSRSQDASCISRVVSRMLSVAYASAPLRESFLDS